jgi:hypothetical protein
MIRMMMWDRTTGDQHFKLMMQDFVETYMGRSATTGDLKQMVEKRMTPEMDLSGNHSMNWFFDEYVYARSCRRISWMPPSTRRPTGMWSSVSR